MAGPLPYTITLWPMACRSTFTLIYARTTPRRWYSGGTRPLADILASEGLTKTASPGRPIMMPWRLTADWSPSSRPARSTGWTKWHMFTCIPRNRLRSSIALILKITRSAVPWRLILPSSDWTQAALMKSRERRRDETEAIMSLRWRSRARAKFCSKCGNQREAATAVVVSLAGIITGGRTNFRRVERVIHKELWPA